MTEKKIWNDEEIVYISNYCSLLIEYFITN